MRTISSFEQFNESAKTPIKYAVSFKIETDYGDVDFDATEYVIKTPEDFFKDASFMKKIKKVVSNFDDAEDFKTIDSVKKLIAFFKHAEKNEYFSGGLFDAMTEQKYKKELKSFKKNQEEDEDDDY